MVNNETEEVTDLLRRHRLYKSNRLYQVFAVISDVESRIQEILERGMDIGSNGIARHDDYNDVLPTDECMMATGRQLNPCEYLRLTEEEDLEGYLRETHETGELFVAVYDSTRLNRLPDTPSNQTRTCYTFNGGPSSSLVALIHLHGTQPTDQWDSWEY